MSKLSTAMAKLNPYERWMVKSNLQAINNEGVPAAMRIAQLRMNGYNDIADAVAEIIEAQNKSK